jgi:hypothetical protein
LGSNTSGACIMCREARASSSGAARPVSGFGDRAITKPVTRAKLTNRAVSIVRIISGAPDPGKRSGYQVMRKGAAQIGMTPAGGTMTAA